MGSDAKTCRSTPIVRPIAAIHELRGSRVLLRQWRPDDLEPFARQNADAVVMEHFPARMTDAETETCVARILEHFTACGFGLWALEVPGEVPFAGFVGLATVGFEASFTPAVEIGWRLAAAHWGKGYATEAARLALGAAFGPVGLREVVSFTVPANVRSWRVMERIGMRRFPHEGFDHPLLAPGHPLRRHLLFRLRREEWAAR